MPSLRERSITAGFAGGFFGQKNRNTEARRIQAENLERMREEAELERSKTAYLETQKRQTERNTFVQTVRAAGGVDDNNKLNAVGFDFVGRQAVPNWDSLEASQKQDWINTALKTDSGLDRWATAFYGPGASGAKVRSAISKPSSPNVDKTTSAILSTINQKNSMVGDTREVVTPNEPAGIRDVKVLGGVEKKVLKEIEATKDGTKGLEVFYEDGSTEFIPSSGDADKDEYIQVTGNFVTEDGRTVAGFRTKEDPRPFHMNPDGSKEYVTLEPDADAEQRVEMARLKAQDKEFLTSYTNNMNALTLIDDWTNTYNTADGGLQGAINIAFEYVETNANVFRSVEEGKMDVLEAAHALGFEGVKSREEAKEYVAGKRQVAMEIAADKAFEDIDGDPEAVEELRSLARLSANNVYKTALIYAAAKSFRGAGKLNTSDVEKIENIIDSNKGPASLLGSLSAIRDIAHSKAKQATRRIIRESDASLSSKIQGGQYLVAQDNSGPPGFLYKVSTSRDEFESAKGAPWKDRPALAVFVDDTGSVRVLKTEEEVGSFLSFMRPKRTPKINL